MRAKEFINELNVDNRQGWGATPNNAEVDYLGLRVMMKPSVFLKLAAPLREPTSKDKIKKHLEAGGSVAAPWLEVVIPPEWEKGIFDMPAHIHGHEGRNRMMAATELEGDLPVETHLILMHGMRNRHLTPQIIQQLNTKIYPQDRKYDWALFRGPYFSQAAPITEDWRNKVAGAALAGTLAYSVGSNMMQQPPQEAPPQRQSVAQMIAPVTASSSPEQLKKFLAAKATQAGLVGKELMHFISQCAHETLDFARLEEFGEPRYFAKKYDPQYAPIKAKAIGNTIKGDGIKFKGRGFIHLTGRYNYKKAGEALGLPLEQNPDMAVIPKVAADIAIWYWKSRVQPKVTDFGTSTVKNVTKQINPGMKGLKSRQTKYQALAKAKQ